MQVARLLTSSPHQLLTLPSRNYYPSQVCNSCIFHNQTEGFRYCLSWLNRQSDSCGCKTKTTKPYCLSRSCSIPIRQQSTWVTVSSFLQIQLMGVATAIQSSQFFPVFRSQAKHNHDQNNRQSHKFACKTNDIHSIRNIFLPSPTK